MGAVSAWFLKALKGGGEPLTSISKKYGLYCALFLTIVNILDQADKWAVPTLQIAGLQCLSCGGDDPEFTQKCNKECLDISDSQMGFLIGPAFSITGVVAGLPIGWIADHVKRVRVLLIGLILWSLATFFSAFVQGFYELAFLRMLLGVGTAALNPTAFSLLSDYFTPAYRSFIMSIFQSAIYLGQDVGLLMGIVAQHYSWRLVFFVLGLPGLICAIPFYLTILEPKRGVFELEDTPTQTEDIPNSQHVGVVAVQPRNLFENDPSFQSFSLKQKILYIIKMPSYVALWVSSCFRFLAGYALGSWIQVYYRRVYGLSPTTISLWLAVIIPLGGLSASYIGGIASDWWKRHLISGAVWVICICSFLAIPFMIGVLLVDDYRVSFLLLLGEYFFAEMWIGPSVAVVQDVCPPSMRSISTAIYFLSLAVGGISPYLVGWTIEWMAIEAPFQDPDSEQVSYDPTYPIMIYVVGNYFISGIGFAISALLVQLRFRSLRKPITSE